jgi:hypothetical protein
MYFAILRHWLRTCDKHPDCEPKLRNTSTGRKSPQAYPTRLLEVGGRDGTRVRLLDIRSRPENHSPDLRYTALSHRWGDRDDHLNISTTKDNLKQRQEWFSDSELPATFRDAVKVTRELDVLFIWIDSLCIIQGPGGEFEDEAERMETVFSDAYCVIAASRATSFSDGFLKSRRDRVCVMLPGPTPYYICEAIDDFQTDVLDGHLNQRGWVLQERALARRSIYFTDTQNYFECGKEICCETLTRMTK